MVNTIINWIDNHSGFSSFITAFILLIVTIYYAWQARNQAVYTYKIMKETNKQIENTVLNYMYLINAEMGTHKNIYVCYIYGKLDDRLLSQFRVSTWNMINVELVKYSPSNLIQELIGYYAGIEILSNMMISLSSEQKLDIIKGQLISMYKCVDIIEAEFKIKLRTQEEFKIDNTIIKIDKNTGDLIKK